MTDARLRLKVNQNKFHLGHHQSLELDRDRGVEDFVVFDAQAMDKGPIARAKMPRRMPLGFHGNWVGA